jgi:hypothetical protein
MLSKPERDEMTTYVLVHGAWYGGWCWREVARPLQEVGHEVLTPTLTGLGDRAHLLTPEIGLRTHVDDIVDLLPGWSPRTSSGFTSTGSSRCRTSRRRMHWSAKDGPRGRSCSSWPTSHDQLRPSRRPANRGCRIPPCSFPS